MALQQHMDSFVHSPELYRCPASPSDALSDQRTCCKKHRTSFSTLGGLCQHLESGSCHDGRLAFFCCADLIQGYIEQLGLGKLHLILPGMEILGVH